MIKNYLKTALRNLARNKTYATINVIGLAVGIAVCLLIFLVVKYETSYDNFHANSSRIYRLGTEFNGPDGKNYNTGVSYPTAKALRNDHPEIKLIAAMQEDDDVVITLQDSARSNANPKKFQEENGVFFIEPPFFKIFNFPMLAGDAATALKDPHTAVLTKEIAIKYFGDWKTAIGQTLQLNNREFFKITGVLEDIPKNTDLPIRIALSHSTFVRDRDDWVSVASAVSTYVVLPDGMTQKSLDATLAALTKKYKPAEYAKDLIVSQPISEIHFDSRFGNYNQRTFSHEMITALILIGVFLLIIACVNFVNLATAQAVNRSREVGVRKVLGSNRMQLAMQFMSETGIITLFALAAGVAISVFAMPMLRQMLNIPLTIHFNFQLVLFLIGLAIIVTALSGFYPAIVVSGFNPITALKSKMSTKVGGISLRRGLVVLQFTIAHILIIGTLIAVNQMEYFRNAPLGFNKEAIITVPVPSDSLSVSKMNYFRDQLLSQRGVKNVSFSFTSPSDDGGWYSDFKYDHAAKNSDFNASLKWADTGYFNTFEIKLVAGRTFRASDTLKEVVVNETFVSRLGVRNNEEVLGKELNMWNGEKIATIVGVAKDFHANSLRDPVVPVMMGSWKSVYRRVGIKIDPASAKETLAFVEKKWNELYPQYVYEYQFLDDRIAAFYTQENQLSNLYKIFAGIAIFISCLGLYGLISFMAVQRTKEVGIRKVLGASVPKIVLMFSKEFTVLIAIAFLIATPVAWYVMHKWLEDFTFRITPGPGIFLLAIGMSVIVAWLAVGYRAVRAALANPIKSLRSE
ncbi:MAG: ABC transporter permease [Gemmatimonadaceae bacterium]|nr:ABC transporter permease [Chitinophagaceae bacterium]